MRIQIEADGKRIWLPIPNVLLFSRTLASFGLWVARFTPAAPHCPDVKDVHALQMAMRRWRRTAPDTTLVEARTADGGYVHIRL